jgi:hypothetical protein
VETKPISEQTRTERTQSEHAQPAPDPAAATRDAKIAAGKGRNSARVRKTVEAVIQSKLKYSKPVSAIGHSLGGRLAEESQADGWIMTVDKATSPLDLLKKPRAGDRQTDVRTAADPVSAVSVLQRGDRRTETIKLTDKLPRFIPYPVRALGNLAKAHSLRNL